MTKHLDLADQLTVQQLRTFCHVHELKSYSAAARKLNLSVPAVWEQVQSLQRRYGVELFEKVGRGITVTLASQQLYQVLQPVLTGLDSSFELLHRERSSPTQPITIVSGVRMMQEELAPAFRRFQREFPKTPLRILHRDNETAQKLVADGGADLALMLRPGPGDTYDSLTTKTVYTVDYLAVVSRRLSLSRKSNWSLEELVSHPLIIGHRGTNVRQMFEQALHRRGLYERMQVAVETDNSAFTIAAARSSMGVGILAGVAGGPLCRGLQARTLHDELGTAEIVCVWKRGRQLSSAMTRWIEVLQEVDSN